MISPTYVDPKGPKNFNEGMCFMDLMSHELAKVKGVSFAVYCLSLKSGDQAWLTLFMTGRPFLLSLIQR